MEQAFAGFFIAEEFDIYRAWRERTVTYTPTNVVLEVRKGPYVRFDCPLTEPDKLGADRFHANLDAHFGRHGITIPFKETTPQQFNTLTDSALALKANAKTSQGSLTIVAKGESYQDVRTHLFPGRWISFAGQSRLYQIVNITPGATAALTTLHLDAPLAENVLVNSVVHLSPKVNWYWDERMYESQPNTAGVWWRGSMFAVNGLIT